MAGWHHQLNGHEFEQALGVGDGQGGLGAAVHWVTKSRTRVSDWTEATLQDVRGPTCHQQALEGELGGYKHLGSTSSAEPHADPVLSGLRMMRVEVGSWVLSPDSSEGRLGAFGGHVRCFQTKTDWPWRLVKSGPHQFLFSNSRDSPQHQESSWGGGRVVSGRPLTRRRKLEAPGWTDVGLVLTQKQVQKQARRKPGPGKVAALWSDHFCCPPLGWQHARPVSC